MDVMLMKNEKDVEDFTLYLLDKYKKAPKLIILLGNSSYCSAFIGEKENCVFLYWH